MKRIFTGLALAIVAIVLSVQFVSCEKYVLPDVSFDPDTLTFRYQGETKPVTLNSNVMWKIELDDDTKQWVKLSTSGDTLGSIIDVTVSENAGSARHVVLTVETEAIEKHLTIIQDGNPDVE